MISTLIISLKQSASFICIKAEEEDLALEPICPDKAKNDINMHKESS